jgi:hypothetical protein
VTCARALGDRQRRVAEGSFGVNRILSTRDLLAVVTATGRGWLSLVLRFTFVDFF